MSGVRKRSLSIRGHSTSVSLEEPFWEALREIASEARMPLAVLVADVDAGRGNDNLSSALRMRVLAHFRAQAAPDAT
jgi:predicted DNA-binding ribbon-helix-helix protein